MSDNTAFDKKKFIESVREDVKKHAKTMIETIATDPRVIKAVLVNIHTPPDVSCDLVSCEGCKMASTIDKEAHCISVVLDSYDIDKLADRLAH